MIKKIANKLLIEINSLLNCPLINYIQLKRKLFRFSFLVFNGISTFVGYLTIIIQSKLFGGIWGFIYFPRVLVLNWTQLRDSLTIMSSTLSTTPRGPLHLEIMNHPNIYTETTSNLGREIKTLYRASFQFKKQKQKQTLFSHNSHVTVKNVGHLHWWQIRGMTPGRKCKRNSGN